MLGRHPELRASLVHAGCPCLAQTIALLHMDPGLHVDPGALTGVLPELEHVVPRLVRAGYLDRLMFGSDAMVWPGAIGRAVERMRGADSLTRAHKEKALCDDAARFFRVDPAGTLPERRPGGRAEQRARPGAAASGRGPAGA